MITNTQGRNDNDLEQYENCSYCRVAHMKSPRLGGLFRASFAIVMWLMALSAADKAEALTVSAGSPGVFAFDVSMAGPLALTNFEIWCQPPTSCDPLAGGAQFGLDFGTAAGGSDIASYLITNPFSTGSTGLSSQFLPEALVGGSVETVFATLRFIDDPFDVQRLRLVARLGGEFSTLTGTPVDVAPVPLPGAAWLMLSGLSVLVLAGRKARR